MTANKQMALILEMYRNATAEDAVMYDKQFQDISLKALMLVEAHLKMKGN